MLLQNKNQELRISKLKNRYFRTTPQQADGAFARKLVGQSTDYHEFFKNKNLRPYRANKETPKQAIGEFFPIKTFYGQPVSNGTVVLTDQNGNVRTATSNAFGYYFLPDIPAGEIYVLTVSHKIYSSTSQIIFASNDLENFDITVF